MSSINFEKVETGDFVGFVCKDGGWQISKKHGFHKSSPARDYLVRWFEKDSKWHLYFTHYKDENFENKFTKKLLITLDTIFDIIDYICKNKTSHYN
jgi:hypothetical protein